MTPEVKMNRGNASLIIILITLLVAALAVFYAVFGFGFGQSLFLKRNSENTVGPVAPRDSQVENLNSQSESDEIEAIDADLNTTNLEDLDKELANVDNEQQGL